MKKKNKKLLLWDILEWTLLDSFFISHSSNLPIYVFNNKTSSDLPFYEYPSEICHLAL